MKMRTAGRYFETLSNIYASILTVHRQCGVCGETQTGQVMGAAAAAIKQLHQLRPAQAEPIILLPSTSWLNGFR